MWGKDKIMNVSFSDQWAKPLNLAGEMPYHRLAHSHPHGVAQVQHVMDWRH